MIRIALFVIGSCAGFALFVIAAAALFLAGIITLAIVGAFAIASSIALAGTVFGIIAANINIPLRRVTEPPAALRRPGYEPPNPAGAFHVREGFSG